MTKGVAITRKQKVALAKKGYRDPVFFCKWFLPELFPDNIPWVHRGLLAILTGQVKFLETYGEVDKLISNFIWERDEEKHSIFGYESGKLTMTLQRFTLIMLPRGFAKTTIAGIAVPLREVLYEDCPFTVYVSESGTHARMQLNNVKREMCDNARVKSVFGDLRPALKDDQKWSEDFFETRTGMAMAARGRGAQVRGLLHRANRPKKIIVDDVEDAESVETEVQRTKTRTWAYADLMPALPRVGEGGTIIALGTLIHRDALLETWRKDPKWTVVKMGAVDKEGELLWAANMNHEDLKIEKASYTRAGMLHVYYMEYFNEVRAPETQIFKEEFFKYGPAEGDLLTAIYCDPAISKARRADSTVIHVAAMSQKGQIWFLESWGKKGADPRETVDKYFELSARYNCIRHGVESNAYQAALIHIMKEEMFRKHQYFEIEPVTHKTKKEDRIIAVLVPRYASGYITHVHRFVDLEIQALDFQRGMDQDDDYLDAAAGCVALLDPFAAQAAGEKDLTEDEYPPLSEVLGADYGEWAS